MSFLLRSLRALLPILALCATSIPGQALAQTQEPESLPVSVYKIDPWADGIILGSAALLDLYPVLNGFHFIHIQSHPSPDNLTPWDQGAIYNRNVFLDNLSDVTVAVSVAAPPLLDLLDVGWHHVLVEDVVVYAQTLAISSALGEFFKYTVQRPIPRVYAGDPTVADSPRGYAGYYSGHVATSMAALSAAALTLDLRHDAGIWPWLVVAAVGASVALERVEAGEHFPTQVLAGSLMGPLVGVAVPWLHKREKEGKPVVSLASTSLGPEVYWRLHF